MGRNREEVGRKNIGWHTASELHRERNLEMGREGGGAETQRERRTETQREEDGDLGRGTETENQS